MQIKAKFFILVIFSLLVGCSYNLTNENFYGTKLFLQAENDDAVAYILIANNGIVSGFSGCNQFNGKASIDQNKQTIKVTSIASTNKVCSDKIDMFEQQFMKVLLATTRYEIKDNQMILQDSKKSKIVALAMR